MSHHILDPLAARYKSPISRAATGRPCIIPTAFYASTPLRERMPFCTGYDMYGLPSTELIGCLWQYIGARTAIEIGAGNGVFSSALRMTGTESRLKADPNVAAVCALRNQPVVLCVDQIVTCNAKDAVQGSRPEVVIGRSVTYSIVRKSWSSRRGFSRARSNGKPNFIIV